MTNDMVLESFIQYCDDMKVGCEAFNVKETFSKAINRLVEFVKTLLKKIGDFIKECRYKFNEVDSIKIDPLFTKNVKNDLNKLVSICSSLVSKANMVKEYHTYNHDRYEAYSEGVMSTSNEYKEICNGISNRYNDDYKYNTNEIVKMSPTDFLKNELCNLNKIENDLSDLIRVLSKLNDATKRNIEYLNAKSSLTSDEENAMLWYKNIPKAYTSLVETTEVCLNTYMKLFRKLESHFKIIYQDKKY